MRSILLLLSILALVSVSHVSAATGKCHALAMSGGGDKAAYEAGVLRGLLASLPASETTWDVVTGISAGSTLTAAFSVFPLGQESAAVDLIYNIIDSLNQSTIFTQWPGGIVEGFLDHSAIFDSTPLRELFEREIGGRTLATDRLTCMGAAQLNSGKFTRFCKHQTTMDAVNAALASSAIPGVLLDQTIDNETYVDGGTVVNVDVLGAVEGCLGLGFAEEDIIVDTVECSGHNLTALTGDLSTLTVLPILLRAGAMDSFEGTERDYLAAVGAYPNVEFRYRIGPTQDIPGSSLDFNHTTMMWMEALGEQDAKDAVNGISKFQTRIILDEE